MQGFKNLLPRNLLNDDSVQPVVKKTDQHRKTTQISLQHIYNVYKNIESFAQSFEGEVFQLHHQLTETQSKLPVYFLELTQLLKNINVQVKVFSEKSNGSYKELNNVCNALFLDYSNVVLNFQQHIRNYQSLEQIVFEMSKRYSRNFKNMVSYLDSYKSSFTDARLIYNDEQKVKRYQICQTAFKTLQDDIKSIQQKCQKLTEKKTTIRQNFMSIQNEMKRTIKVISSKFITETKGFVKNYSQFQKTIVTFLAQKKFSLQKLSIPTFFESLANTKCSQYFSCPIKQSDCQVYPAIFVYIEYIKPQYLPYCKTAFLNYLKQANNKVEKRKEINRQVLQLLKLYNRMVQKHQYNNLKQLVSNFQKLKKRLSQLFSSRFVSFLKSIHSIFQLSIGINQKLLKTYSLKVKTIQTCILEQNKHMQMFIKQLRINVEKFIGKKQTKKPSNNNSNQENMVALNSVKDIRDQPTNIGQMNRSALFMEDSFAVVDNTQFRKQIVQRSQFLIHLITGFVSKLQANEKSLKTNISSIVHDYSESSNEFYSLCCQYETIYFGEQQFLNNYKKYETDIDKNLDKQTAFMKTQLGFKALVQEQQENRKIIFEDDLIKVQEFKKLKKPSLLDGDIPSKKTISDSQKNIERKQSNGSDLPFDQQTGMRTPPAFTTNNSQLEKSAVLSNSSQLKQNSGINNSNQKSDKYFQLLSKKITFFEGQQYNKSFSCAFYDKIILQGRIYITNQRLCFHSKFNPTNIFFGGTFIQIPKKDITKVEKRYNALVFDNSIAVSTVNGQMFFTSFFSRDEAWQLITKSMDINLDEEFFQAEEQFVQKEEQSIASKQVEFIEQQDDLKIEQEKSREQEILKILEVFPYQTLVQTQMQVPKINAMKYFRLFDSGQQINHNRRTHKSFLQFCKDLVGHKQIQVHHFKPNILQYLNFNNIKSNTPFNIERKLTAMVPISAAGVPFMPKAARSDEVQKLNFVSKNKYFIESTIQNSGAPYTDCFNVKLKRTIESTEENKVKFKVQMHVNFMKSTMMKGMIESKAVQETKSYFLKMSQEAKKYFKNIQKMRRPQQSLRQKAINSQQSTSQSVQLQKQVQQTRKQLDQSLEQKQILQQKLKTSEGNQAKYKQYLFISIVVNIFLFLLLLN